MITVSGTGLRPDTSTTIRNASLIAGVGLLVMAAMSGFGY